MRIRVANLSHWVEDRALARLFARHGVVRNAHVTIEQNSGHSTGIGVVEMESDAAGEEAIASLNGSSHHGQVLSVQWSGGRG
jgi:RNA recognition motif-containing protein